MPPHLLTNFEIQKYYQNELKFNGVYSKNNFTKIKDGANIINLEEYESIGTHCIALYLNAESVIYFSSSRVEHIQKKKKKFIGNKNTMTNIYKTRAFDSKMYEYFCIGLIDFILIGKYLLEYINLLSRNEYKKNDKVILKYFQ